MLLLTLFGFNIWGWLLWQKILRLTNRNWQTETRQKLLYFPQSFPRLTPSCKVDWLDWLTGSCQTTLNWLNNVFSNKEIIYKWWKVLMEKYRLPSSEVFMSLTQTRSPLLRKTGVLHRRVWMFFIVLVLFIVGSPGKMAIPKHIHTQ